VDYVKGAKEMLLCYERLLERRPEMRGKVNLIMTAVKAAAGMRVYKTAQSQIEQLVGKINGKYAKLNWTPIQLFTEPIPFNDLMALYKTADIAWIPPLRDGLNLVAKEYIAAHHGENGVLMLSEFTGSAVELPDAVLTNPYADKNMDECDRHWPWICPPKSRSRGCRLYKPPSPATTCSSGPIICSAKPRRLQLKNRTSNRPWSSNLKVRGRTWK
jgi:glucosylglycerol-phosphate synthase